MPTQWTPPPNWPPPPTPGWAPPPGWQPDPSWGPPPDGWIFYPEVKGWAVRHTLLTVVLAMALVVAVGGIAVGIVAAVRNGSSSSGGSATSVPSASIGHSASPAPASINVVPVPGYSYTALPANVAPIVSEIKATGLTSAVVGRGVERAGSNQVDLAIVILQYTPTIGGTLDKTPVGQVLGNAARGAEAFVGSDAKIADYVLSGTKVRTLTKSPLSMAIAYQRGGRLIEIFGPAHSPVLLSFTSAYLAANS